MLLFFASKKESGWSYWSAARKKPQISGWVHLCKTDRQRLYHPHISRAWWDLYATFRGNTVEQAAHRFFSKHLWPQTTEEKNFAFRMRIKQAKQLKNVESFYHPKTKLVIDEVLKMTYYQTWNFLVWVQNLYIFYDPCSISVSMIRTSYHHHGKGGRGHQCSLLWQLHHRLQAVRQWGKVHHVRHWGRVNHGRQPRV